MTVDRDETSVTVTVTDTLDEDSACLIALWLTPVMLLDAPRRVVLDIALVTSVTAAGLDVLADLVELAGLRHTDFHLVAATLDAPAPLRVTGRADPLPSALRLALASYAPDGDRPDVDHA